MDTYQQPTGVRVELHTTAAGLLELPPLAEDRLKIHAGPPVRGACSAHRFLYTRGDIDIQPTGYSDRWQEFQPNTSLIVHLPRVLLMQAAEDLGVHPQRATLSPNHQVRDERIEHIAWALDAERRADHPNGSLFVESLGLALAIHLLCKQGGRSGPAGEPSERTSLSPTQIRRVTSFIEEHLDQNLSIARLARVAAISASHLKTVFKRAMGVPVHEYVIHRRVERARLLLTRGELPVSQVALETGFAHQSHMARSMRRVLGVTPRSLRASDQRAGQENA